MRDDWQRVKEVLDRVLARSPADRASAMEDLCGDNAALRREIEELLSCHDEMGSFLETPVVTSSTPLGAGGSLDSDSDAPIPTEIKGWNQYEVTERVGSGGMAVVYKRWDPRLNRPVAIKVISGYDEVAIRRFLREAEAQARVDHDNVLKVYETGIVGRHHYIAMQYVDGPTLLGVRDETTLEQKVSLMLGIAEGLHAAHRRGLVHRDIKPSNILVERGPEGLTPRLLDFGLAVEVGAPALTMTGVVVGTPRYMAPERVHESAAALDRRSDIYSLGATFYEFISGKAPFASASGLQVLVDVLHSDPEPLRHHVPGLPPELDAIVAKCLEREPDRRYSSSRELADDLRRYLDGDPVLARSAGAFERLGRKVRKHPRLAMAFGVLASLTLAVAAWGAYGYWRASRQAELAQTFGQEVRDLEWMFRAAQMSPLHGLDLQKQRVRDRMARVSDMMRDVGSIGFAPGEYALGRGYLTLGEHVRAIEHLERAWNSGYRTPDAATALGVAHGEVLRAELAAAQRLGGDEERNARLKELEATRRERALYYLEEGRQSSLFPAPYMEALIASHHRDRPGAIARAEEAAVTTPWLFEARLLQGHLEFEEAVRLYFVGDHRGCADRADEADRYYAEGHRVAPSSVDAYLGRCAVIGLVLQIVQHAGNAGEHALSAARGDRYEQDEDTCQRALIIDRNSAEGHRLFSEALRTKANLRVLRRENPGDAYDRAAALSERAIALLAGEPDPILALADTYLDRAWWQSRTEQDPRPSVEAAVTTYEKALAIDPRNVAGTDNMGQALILLARSEAARGFDPIASYGRAIEAFTRTLRAYPTLAPGFTNISRTAIARPDAQVKKGVDPSRGLEAVIRFVEGLPGDAAGRRTQGLETMRERLAGATHASPLPRP